MVAEKRTIAITGATGLIGSHLLPLLLGEGYRLRALSRRPQQDLPGISQIQGDIRSARAVRDLIQGCVHAQGGPPFITDDPGTPGNHHWEINFGWIANHNPGASPTTRFPTLT